jgi:hypothetical protein
LKEDRRQRHIDFALEANGFAIVPTAADSTEDETPPTRPLAEVPIEHLAPEHEENQESIESIGGLQQSGRLIPTLLGILIGVTVAALLLSLAGANTGQSLVRQLFTGSPSGGSDEPAGLTDESFTPGQLQVVTEKPAVVKTRPARTETPPRPDGESPPTDDPASTKPLYPLGANKPTPTRRETSRLSEAADAASREPGTTAGEAGATAKQSSRPPRVADMPAGETGAPAKAGTDQVTSGGGSRFTATAKPSPEAPASSPRVASALSPEAATPKTAPAQLVHSPHAELVRRPVSRGWGDSYAVRLVDAAGRPMVVPSVWLVARMADGSVERVAMGALPEPGTYRGTVPTSRSTPVDLLVRVSTGDRFVEVPVKP